MYVTKKKKNLPQLAGNVMSVSEVHVLTHTCLATLVANGGLFMLHVGLCEMGGQESGSKSIKIMFL